MHEMHYMNKSCLVLPKGKTVLMKKRPRILEEVVKLLLAYINDKLAGSSVSIRR